MANNVSENNLRILELLPGLLKPLAVEPAIPADFVAMSKSGEINLYDWVYWGPKDVLKEYFANPESLKVPILSVKLSGNVAQVGPSAFSDDQTLKMMQQQNPKNFSFTSTQWGDYPVRVVKTEMQGQALNIAWVGLNDPESGWTLMFNLVHAKNIPSKEDLEFWDNFISKTQPLKDGDFFKAQGQDFKDGYTLVNVGGVKLKMVAEKRISDGMMQVVVTPESPNTQFRYRDMSTGLMGCTWKQGEPVVKVYGEIEMKDGNATNIINHTTSIFYKSVNEFTFQKEEGKNEFVYQKAFKND